MIQDKQYIKKEKTYNFTTAETHNFPTGVCPFPGAATGIGGRIRDGQSVEEVLFLLQEQLVIVLEKYLIKIQ